MMPLVLHITVLPNTARLITQPFQKQSLDVPHAFLPQMDTVTGSAFILSHYQIKERPDQHGLSERRVAIYRTSPNGCQGGTNRALKTDPGHRSCISKSITFLGTLRMPAKFMK